MPEEHLFFQVGDIELEGVLHLPDGDGPFAAAVVCHPHTDFGGDMNNNVVMGLTLGLLQKGIAALRFNFRGAGRSGGRCEQGEGEVEDVSKAVDYLLGRTEVDPEKIFLAGYSFGALVGLKVAVDDSRFKAWVAVSPPLIMGDFSYLSSCPKPKFLIAGDRDSFCQVDEFKALFSSLQDPKRIEIFSGVDHFYWGFDDAVGKMAAGFLSGI